MPSSLGKEFSFREIASRFEQKLGKRVLQTAPQLTQGKEVSLEQWGDCVMEIAQPALGTKVPGEVLQKQPVMLFAISKRSQGTAVGS